MGLSMLKLSKFMDNDATGKNELPGKGEHGE